MCTPWVACCMRCWRASRLIPGRRPRRSSPSGFTSRSRASGRCARSRGARGRGQPGAGQDARGPLPLHGGVRRSPVESGAGHRRVAGTGAEAAEERLGARPARSRCRRGAGPPARSRLPARIGRVPGSPAAAAADVQRAGDDPAISPDGTSLAYVRDRRELVLEPVAGGTATTLVEAKSWIIWPRWSPDGQWLYFTMLRTNTELPASTASRPGEERPPGSWTASRRRIFPPTVARWSGPSTARWCSTTPRPGPSSVGSRSRPIPPRSVVRGPGCALQRGMVPGWSLDRIEQLGGEILVSAADGRGSTVVARDRLVRCAGDREAPRSTISPSSREEATASSGCRSTPAAVRRLARSEPS